MAFNIAWSRRFNILPKVIQVWLSSARHLKQTTEKKCAQTRNTTMALTRIDDFSARLERQSVLPQNVRVAFGSLIKIITHQIEYDQGLEGVSRDP